MALFNQDSSGAAPLQEAEAFLRLLDEVSLIQRLLLEETEALRARVRELEAKGGEPGALEGRSA